LGKLRVMSGREACEILSSHGFVQVRQRGSHIVMQRRHGLDTSTVIVPDHDKLARGTLGSIIRQCGLGRELFEV
jgi:predicted RNA binding protein YcfA (HicA-like mRNA interferase family)